MCSSDLVSMQADGVSKLISQRLEQALRYAEGATAESATEGSVAGGGTEGNADG